MGQYPKMGKNRQDIPQHIPSAYALLSIFDKGRGIIVWIFLLFSCNFAYCVVSSQQKSTDE